MDTLYFLDYMELACYMVDNADDGKAVTAVLFYDDAKELLKELACYEETEIGSIDLHEPEWNGYDKEFYITLDDNLTIWVEEAYHEIEETGFKGYFRFGFENSIALIDGNASSLIVKAAEENDYIAEIEIGENCDKDCNECVFDNDSEDLKDIIEYIFKNIFEE